MFARTSVVCVGVVVVIQSICARAPAASGQPPAWNVLSEVKAFAATPDKIRAEQRPNSIDRITGQAVADAASQEAVAGYSVQSTLKGFRFRVQGNVPDVRTMRWDCPLPPRDAAKTPYYSLRYRARGQRRNRQPLAVVAVSGIDAKGKSTTVPLLDCAQVLNDGLWHVLIGRKPLPATVKGLQVLLSTVDSEATLEIDSCAFDADRPSVPEAFVHQVLDGDVGEGFRCLDLSALFNDTYTAAVERAITRFGLIVDGGNPFADERISVWGVPFEVRRHGKNIVMPASDPQANTGTVNVLGTELEKRNYHRVARDDKIEVPASGKAAEVCFILVSEMPSTIGRYALPKIPLQLYNTDTFVVEIIYANGESDFAFPYSMADAGHSLQRMTGAYAIPANPNRELTSIIFHNRYYGGSFSLAAVTLNSGPAKVLTQELRAPAAYRVTQVTRPVNDSPQLSWNGGIADWSNAHYQITADCREGFAIQGIRHRWAETKIGLDGSSAIEVQVGNELYGHGAFRTQSVTPRKDGLRLELVGKEAEVPLRMVIEVTVDQTEQIRFNATVTNTGAKPISATIRFPLFRGLAIGEVADTWMYFPQCRNVCSNQPGTYLAPNDRPFPMQFFDVFNPKAGIGIAFLTHNFNQDVLDYSVRKDRAGVTAFVQYPAEYHVIEPGREIRLTETCMVFHGGDWHGALAAYQDWLKTWYEPVKTGGLDWWYQSFALRAHLTRRSYSWAVPIFDAEKTQYRVAELLKEDRDYLGLKTQVVHLGGWVDYNNMHAGDFLGGDYAVEDYTGGANVLRAAVRKMQDNGIRVSVYTIPDRCAKNSHIGQELGPKIAQLKANGKLAQDANCWYLCLGAEPWQDHYVEALKRTQRELGLDAVYVDVFGYTRGYACYSKQHGHETPLNVNKACNQLIRRLRAELPEGVAIWSEFPLPDVSSQYTSGNITYYFLTLHEYMVKSYDQSGRAPLFTPVAQSVHRFAFPHVKQFGFPVGFKGGPSSHELRFLFFNGEGLYDVGWLLYDSRDLARVRNWLALQTRYADCFASTRPRPLVPTVAGQVFANEFPGDGRTAWTIFNARFATYRGPVIRLEHRDGDTYRDAWNHKDIQPEIVDGKATIELTLDPQGLGCVVRTRGNK